MTGFTEVSAAHLQDATGTPITNATISFLPVANNGTPIPFRTGGTQGQTVSQAVTAVVDAGEFSIQLADTSMTSPVNVGYRVTVTDNVSGKVLLSTGYECVQPTGTNWSLDTYIPNVPAQVTITAGPDGKSAYEIAVGDGFVGTEQQWTASLQGPPGPTSYATLSSAIGVTAKEVLTVLGASPTRQLFNKNAATTVPGLLLPDGTINHAFDANCRVFQVDLTGETEFTTNVELGFGGAGGAVIYKAPDDSVLSNAVTDIAANSTVTFPAGATQMLTTIFFGGEFATAIISGGAVLADSSSYIAMLPENTNLTRESAAIQAAVNAAIYVLQGKSPFPATNFFDFKKTVPGRLRLDGTLDTTYPGFFTTGILPNAPQLVSAQDLGDPTHGLGVVWYASDRVTIVDVWEGYQIVAGVPFAGSTKPGAVFWRAWGYGYAYGQADPAITAGSAPLPLRGVFFGATVPNPIPPFSAPNQPGWFGANAFDLTDSIFANSNTAAYLAQNNGLNFVYRDEQAGRTFTQLFNSFQGGLASGLSVAGPYPAGQTLAQVLSTVKIGFVSSGGNDMGDVPASPYGSYSDPAATDANFLTPGTSSASRIRYIMNALSAAAPSAVWFWVSPYNMPLHGSSTTMVNLVDSIAPDFGWHFINAQRDSGINSSNWPLYIRQESDGTLLGHLNDRGRDERYVPMISRAIQRFSPSIA